MKTPKTLLPIAFALAAGGSPALAEQGELVAVDVRTVFVPIGFDDNDEAEVILDGYLPSGCYRVAGAETSVDHDARRVVVKAMARFFDVPCLEILVPFKIEAKLGQLAEGTYTIEVQGPSTTLSETLPVKHSFGPSPDDYPYVPVDDVTVDLDRVEHQMVATVRGRFTSTCMRWQEAKVEDHGKTVNVLPILRMELLDRCEPVERPFVQRVVLPESISYGRHLLHVRSMNGQAVNQVFFKGPR